MRIVRYYPRALAGDGGITGAVRRWSQAFVRQGSTTVVVYHDDRQPPRTDFAGVEWVPLRRIGHRGLSAPLGLAETLRGADVLVLHSAWTSHNVAAAGVARRLQVPYLLEPRGAYDPHIVARNMRKKQLWWTMFERPLVDAALAVHLFFDEERPHLQALGYRGPHVIVPNGTGSPAGYDWDGGSSGAVVWLGRLDPEHKGLDLLLLALKHLPEALRPPVRLYGMEWRRRRQDVAAMVAELGLQDCAVLEDEVHGSSKYTVLSQAAGFVYPSRWEAFGNSVMEAACLGIPSVVTPYPLGCYLSRRSAAILSEATPQSLAEALVRVQSPESAILGARAREIARTDFDWDTVARSWLRQVQQLL